VLPKGIKKHCCDTTEIIPYDTNTIGNYDKEKKIGQQRSKQARKGKPQEMISNPCYCFKRENTVNEGQRGTSKRKQDNYAFKMSTPFTSPAVVQTNMYAFSAQHYCKLEKWNFGFRGVYL
jgi:hypothetical protein